MLLLSLSMEAKLFSTPRSRHSRERGGGRSETARPQPSRLHDEGLLSLSHHFGHGTAFGAGRCRSRQYWAAQFNSSKLTVTRAVTDS